MKTFKDLRFDLEEKTLTPAEKKKREEVAKAIERENPNMPMGMKMAIATKTAKRVAEETKYYSLVHKATNKVLSTHKDLDSAKDEHRGMDQGERAHYRIATSTKEPKTFNMKEEDHQIDELSKNTLSSYLQKRGSMVSPRSKNNKGNENMAKAVSKIAKKTNEEVDLGEAVHRIGLTVTDPNHPMVSKRKETIQKTVRITSDNREKAINSAKAHYRRKGYKVHDHHYLGTVNEEIEQELDEANPIKNSAAEAQNKIQSLSKNKLKSLFKNAHPDSAKRMSEEVKDEYARKVNKYLKKKYNKEEIDLEEGMKPYVSSVSPKLGEKGSHDVMDKEGKIVKSFPYNKFGMKAAQAHLKKIKEEIEQVDEVSKKTAISYIQKKVSQIAKRPGEAMLYTTKMNDKDYSNLKRAYKRAGVKEEVELDETKSAPKGFHFTKDGKLKRGDADQDGPGGPMLRSDPLDKTRSKVPPVSEEHYCAKHVYSNVYGEGVVLEGQHADPDENGNIEWYVVEFAEGPKKVYTEKLDIMVAEYHGNHKKKRMTNG